MLELDIATRIVGPDEDIYIVRPGAEFTLYEEFNRRSQVFLDFPGVGLDRSRAFPKDSVARTMIMKSMAIKEWHDAGAFGAHPPVDNAHYEALARGRRLGRYVGALKRLHYDLPVGAIVVVPGPGYFSDVLIGEITKTTADIRIDPPSIWSTPMLAFRSWRGVSDECREAPDISGVVQA